MKIKFKDTSENSNGLIEYSNVRGQVVRTYPLAELEAWVIENGLNLSSVSANGCISSDPNIIEEEIEQDVTDYIDDNWGSVTQAFYMDKNPSEFKSGNSPQQTRKGV